ncbi:Uncharacterised protein [Chlamydia trachomatis]|nr:Uncharacterised protein [Chlamydia trachomatis]
MIQMVIIGEYVIDFIEIREVFYERMERINHHGQS